jgi:hypothetical protein
MRNITSNYYQGVLYCFVPFCWDGDGVDDGKTSFAPLFLSVGMMIALMTARRPLLLFVGMQMVLMMSRRPLLLYSFPLG